MRMLGNLNAASGFGGNPESDSVPCVAPSRITTLPLACFGTHCMVIQITA